MKICESCELGKQCTNPCQFGVGNSSARIMIVGDAPTKGENDADVVFGTRSALNIRQSLEKRGIPVSEIYWTYAIKCPVPNPAKISVKQVTQCKPILQKEIELVKPEIIVPMGNASLKAVYGITGITKNRGRAMEVPGEDYIVFPIIHPKICINQPLYKELILKDFDTLAEVYNKGVTKGNEIKYLSSTDPKEIIDYMKKLETECQSGDPDLEWLAFDLETTGSNPYLEGQKIVSISLANRPDEGIAFPIRHRESQFSPEELETILAQLRQLLENPNIKKVNQNGKFDIKWLDLHENIKVKNYAFDTQFAHYISINEEPGTQGLKSQAWEFTDMGGYDNDLEEFKSTLPASARHNYDNIPWRILAPYGAGDVICVIKLVRMYREIFKSNEKWQVMMDDILIPGTYALKEVEDNGMYFNKETAEHYTKAYNEELERLQDELTNYPEVVEIEREKQDLYLQRQALMKSVPAKQRTEEQKKFIQKAGKYKNFTFNWNSTDQLRELFFDKLGLTTTIKTDTGALSTNADALEELAEQHPIANKLVEYRKISVLNNMFIQKLPTMVDKNSIVHPSFNSTGTVTCRMSSDNPNAQQFPRKSEDCLSFQYHHEPKKLFSSRFNDPKYLESIGLPSITGQGCILNADYSQLELRLAAVISKDKNMTDAFLSGADIHKATASKVWGIPVEEVPKDLRTQAKAVNFGVIYGKSGVTFGNDIFMKPPYNQVFEQAKKSGNKLVADYFKAYPDLEKWLKAAIAFAKKYGYVETLFGFRRHLANIHSRDHGIRANAERQAMNSPIQGTGSHMTQLSIVKIQDWLTATHKHTKMICSVHDSIVFDVYVPELPEVAAKVKNIMEHIHEPYFDTPVPILSELELGLDYGSSFDADLSEVQKLGTPEAFTEWFTTAMQCKHQKEIETLKGKNFSEELIRQYVRQHNLTDIIL